MVYLLYLAGFLPSLIWLLFYLRKDKHPESNTMVIKVFFAGMLSAIFALIVELIFQEILNIAATHKGLSAIFSIFPGPAFVQLYGATIGATLMIFIGGALVEEYAKYLAVKKTALKSSELDEPHDLVLYMIIAALGFAALENILVLTNIHPLLTANTALSSMAWRFVSATFLHALCSGTLGYFLAMHLCNIHKSKKFIILGLIISASLHGVYNWFIMKSNDWGRVVVPLFILIVLSCFVSYSFNKLKKIKSVCKIK